MTGEFDRLPKSGWVVLPLLTLLSFGVIGGLIWAIWLAAGMKGSPPDVSRMWPALHIVGWCLSILVTITLWCGFFTLQPNTAAVMTLFGEYKGTVRSQGFHYANPFYSMNKVSLRVRNFNSEKLKVNDARGNPVDIAAIVVWRVKDTALAVFEVDDYVNYVHLQSESAVRHLASRYPYDSHEDNELSLRGSLDEVSHALTEELQERLAKAGVIVEEARLSHLAYAPEIAGAMLRRQQAEAIVAARRRIVDGAVGMVQMALEHIDKEKIVELDTERKASMISNLLVVLCGEQAAQPVVNTGTLYS